MKLLSAAHRPEVRAVVPAHQGGLALEVDAVVKDISKGWPLMLLDRVADEVAEHEQVRESVKAGLFSMEVSGKGMPKSLVTEEGRGAVLLGVKSRTLPSHFSTPYEGLPTQPDFACSATPGAGNRARRSAAV